LPSDPLILAFDTSAAHCAAALLCGGRTMAERFETMDKGQGERLLGLLAQVLADHGAVWGDLDGIGVGTGPGNFTGIRIAVSAARGLALSLGVPAIGVSGFEILHRAAARPGEMRHLIALPHRSGWYLQELLDGQRAGAPLSWSDDDAGAALPRLSDPAQTVVLGHGAGLIARRLEQVQHRPVAFREAALPWPLAAGLIASIAAGRWAVPQERPAPLYVRAPDAAPPRDPAPVILP